MTRPRILLDCDGPLTDGFAELACAFLRQKGFVAYPRLISGWDIFKSFDVPAAIEREVRSQLQKPYVAQSFLARDGSRRFLEDVRRWADVYAVTAPLDGSPTWAYDRERWLVSNLGFKHDEIVFARDKAIVRGDALVDDRHSHVVAWQEAHPDGVAVLWREPHNAKDAWARVASSYDGLRAWLKPLHR
jgi:5'(3')-deoxyribonucleotidase